MKVYNKFVKDFESDLKLLEADPDFTGKFGGIEKFKKDLSKEQLASLLKPTLTYSTKFEGYYPTVRSKLSCEGARKTRCWNAEKQPIPVETVDFQSCELTPILQVKGLWFQANSFGFVFNVSDCLCKEQSKECPF